MIRPKNPINIATIEACPALTGYEKKILILVYVDDKNVKYVAKHFSKTLSTISIQNKKAVQKYDGWASGEGSKVLPSLLKLPEKTPNKTRVKIAKEANGSEDEGELAAQAFKLFKKGLKPPDVVIKLRQPPSIIKRLFQEFKGLPADAPIEEYADISRRLKQLEEKHSDIIGLIAKQENDLIGFGEEDEMALKAEDLTPMFWVCKAVTHLVETFPKPEALVKQLEDTLSRVNTLKSEVKEIQWRLNSLFEKCPECGHKLSLLTHCDECGRYFKIKDKSLEEKKIGTTEENGVSRVSLRDLRD